MTAMPAWGEVLSDAKVADIVLFLEALPAITPRRFAELRRQAGGTASAPHSHDATTP
jgi:hypothetical protein